MSPYHQRVPQSEAPTPTKSGGPRSAPSDGGGVKSKPSSHGRRRPRRRRRSARCSKGSTRCSGAGRRLSHDTAVRAPGPGRPPRRSATGEGEVRPTAPVDARCEPGELVDVGLVELDEPAAGVLIEGDLAPRGVDGPVQVGRPVLVEPEEPLSGGELGGGVGGACLVLEDEELLGGEVLEVAAEPSGVEALADGV